MAKKKIEPIVSLGNEDNLIVQKSLPLFSLWRSSLTLAEFKILDIYLSRIDSHKPDKKTVVFEKGELEKILGVKRIRTEELDERLVHLGTPIRIDDVTAKNKRFARISLFEKSVAEQDDNGIWKVELTASQSAMKYFFNVENLRYLRYKLRCITSLTSRYAYIMFIYLERNRIRKSWEVPLDELKQILACDKEETYKEYKHFNNLILKKVHKELSEKTECRYSYEPVKKGRSVVAVRFTLKNVSQLAAEDVEGFPDDLPDNQASDRPLWESALGDWKLSEEQLDELAALLEIIPKSKLPEADDVEHAKYKYIALKAAEIKRRSQEKRISNRFAYLKKMIDADIQKIQNATDPKSNTYVPTGTQAFRNYTERDPAANAEKYSKKIYDQYKQQQ